MKVPSIATTYYSAHGHTKQATVMLQRFFEAKELLVHNVPGEDAETQWQQLYMLMLSLSGALHLSEMFLQHSKHLGKKPGNFATNNYGKTSWPLDLLFLNRHRR